MKDVGKHDEDNDDGGGDDDDKKPHDGGRITYFHGQGSLDELDENAAETVAV